jgi:hypothetical protein
MTISVALVQIAFGCFVLLIISAGAGWEAAGRALAMGTVLAVLLLIPVAVLEVLGVLSGVARWLSRRP